MNAIKYLVIEHISNDQYVIQKIHSSFQEALKHQSSLDNAYLFPVNKDKIIYTDEILSDLLNLTYRRLANHFGYDFETFMTIRKIECMSCRHIVTAKFIHKFGLTASQYIKLEESIFGKKLDTSTIYNRLRRHKQIMDNLSFIDKTILIIIDPYI